ncbi:MAG: ABC transporter permease subunit [Acidimicrobiales bacterium]|nr:ABC transporter permease subunit [Acidimicrobiales bacterium]
MSGAAVRAATRAPVRAGSFAVQLIAVSVLVLPLLVVTLQAVSRGWFYPDVLPRELTFDPAGEVLGRRRTLAALADGLAVGASVTVVAFIVGWPAARVLAGRSLRARGLVFGVLFLPSLLPAVGLAMGVNIVLLHTPLRSSMGGVVVAHLVPTLPYAVALLTAVFVRTDVDQERQAAVLGASPWQRFRMVTLPAAAGGLAVAAALVFLVSWSQYLLTLLAGGGQVVTITMLLFSALSGGNPTTIAVLALCAALPSVGALAVASVCLREGGGR